MVWYLVLFLLTSSALAAEKSLVLVEAPSLIVDQNGTASAIIILRNDTGTPIPQLRLDLSDFTHKRPDGTPYPLGTARTLTAVNDGDKPIFDRQAPLPVDATLSVRVSVTKLWEAGQSEAILKNGDSDIPVLGGLSQSFIKAIRIPAAYNVQIVSLTPDTPEIHFVGPRALLGLKNSDPFTYYFSWKLHLNGQLFDGGEKLIELPPSASMYVPLERPAPHANFPEPRWLTAGTLKDEIVKGDLVLEPVFKGDAMTQPLPPKDLPVMFRLSYFSDNWQQFSNVLWIFLLLAVGGVFSIWVHAGMPNTARALALKRRIDDLDTKIRGLGASVDSRWRVLLKSHLPALRRELYSTFWIFPSFATTLEGLTKKVDMVQQWVEIAYSASIVLHQADQNIHLIPPTILLWLRERCAGALTPIESGLTTTEEIEAMKADLNKARNYLAVTMARTQNTDLDKEITDRENRLKSDLAGLASDTTYAQCTGLVKQVMATIDSHTPPSPVNYGDRDVCSLKVDLLWTFDQRKKQISGDTGTEALKRLEACLPKLMAYLVADTHESLRMARLIVDEMRQDIYDDALTSQITQTSPEEEITTMAITTDPATIQTQSPVCLALRFRRQLLNEAAARQAWTCSWDFGDNTPPEDGWEVSHSYELPGTRQLKVTIRDLDGKPISPSAVRHEVTVGDSSERSVSRRSMQSESETWPDFVRHVLTRLLRLLKLEPETRLELIRLVIVLTLALIGLMAAARQQAQSLSFLEAVGAVVALGFSVDTIKNLIVQGSSSR